MTSAQTRKLLPIVSTLIDDLEALEIPAAISGLLAMIIHDIHPLAELSTIELIIFTDNPISAAHSLFVMTPDVSRVERSAVFYTTPNETVEVNLYCAGPACPIPGYRFTTNEIVKVDGISVVVLDRLLLLTEHTIPEVGYLEGTMCAHVVNEDGI